MDINEIKASGTKITQKFEIKNFKSLLSKLTKL